MNKDKKKHQPHLLNVLLSGVLLFVNKKFFPLKPISTQLGSYTLEREFIKRDKSDANFSIGTYIKEDKKYFIKTWSGFFKDTNYYSLQNEFLVNETIQTYLSSNKELSDIGIPRVVEIIEDKNSLSVVFEFIDAKTLNEFPTQYQVKTFARVFEALESISYELKKEHRSFFASRGAISYLITLPIIVFLALIHNVDEIPTILITAFWCVRAYFRSYPNMLKLAHRDMGPDNIIVSGEKLYLVDLELFALTYPLYDITSLGVEPAYSEIVTEMRKNFTYVEDEFLKLFIFLRRAAFSSDFRELKAHLQHRAVGLYV